MSKQDDKSEVKIYSAVVAFIALLIVIYAIAGCSPRIIERTIVQHDTTKVHHRDTTFRRDSVYIKEWMKGDTVYRDRFRDRYIFRDRWRDSITVRETHDTTTIEVRVEKPLSWVQRQKIEAFWWLVAGLAAAILWIIFRKKLIKLFAK